MSEKNAQRLKDLFKTMACFAIATIMSYFLKINGNTTDAMAVIYILNVVVISRITNGYIWGILASVGGVVGTNWVFTYPYLKINFSLTGYQVTFSAMLIISVIISALTTQYKKQIETALAVTQKLQETYEERRAMEIVAEKEKLKNNLLRAISHDLRTPLTTIIGASSTIMENESFLDKETHDFLIKDINEESQWLLRVVQNLLAITHISQDTMKVKKTPEVGEEIVAEAISRLKSKFPGHNVTVKVPDEILIIPMDGILVEQVLINLVDNSIKHSGAGSDIFITLKKEDDWAVFTVEDNGMGIEKEFLQHLFDYGEKKDNSPSSDSSRGFGIGLPTCKSIILAHSGQITVESELGKGSQFIFKLPLDATDDGDFMLSSQLIPDDPLDNMKEEENPYEQ